MKKTVFVLAMRKASDINYLRILIKNVGALQFIKMLFLGQISPCIRRGRLNVLWGYLGKNISRLKSPPAFTDNTHILIIDRVPILSCRDSLFRLLDTNLRAMRKFSPYLSPSNHEMLLSWVSSLVHNKYISITTPSVDLLRIAVPHNKIGIFVKHSAVLDELLNREFSNWSNEIINRYTNEFLVAIKRREFHIDGIWHEQTNVQTIKLPIETIGPVICPTSSFSITFLAAGVKVDMHQLHAFYSIRHIWQLSEIERQFAIIDYSKNYFYSINEILNLDDSIFEGEFNYEVQL
jgi:hypothetical protein